ncbi:MAG TPA: C25 family cysteine peptidase [Pirellulaceae bacterium]|nr:C25 family cysteine peptidase [Pirellulaceae bacterium]
MPVLMLLLTMLAPTAPPVAPDVIVVAADDMLPALKPWFAHRQAQGHTIGVLSNTLSADELRASLRATAHSGKLKYVLLVGDAVADRNDDAAAVARLVPTHLQKAKVNVLWGSEPEIATDNWLADLDDDELPDLALGRLPADNPAELSRMVAKIIAYETSTDHGEWRKRINLIAGVGGFGALVDSVLEMSTRKFLCDGIPAGYTTNMTYGSWRSPYCPDPRRFHDATLDRMNEGCLFWVYIGHGQKTYLDRVQVPGRNYHILAANDAIKCRCEAGQPIAIFLACYTGAFDQPDDCLAEEFLRREQGPVAVLSGSRVTMPYAMAVLGTNMLDEYFQNQRATLGEVVLHAKRRMMATEAQNPNRVLLDSIAQAISPRKDMLEEERREHLALFNLLGDPLLALRHPEPVTLTTKTTSNAGDEIEITGHAPIAGECQVELICRRDQLKLDAPKRDQYNPDSTVLAAYHETYAAANDRCWTSHVATIQAGEFRTKLTIPAECRGFCHVRVSITGADKFALGTCNVYVHGAKK